MTEDGQQAHRDALALRNEMAGFANHFSRALSSLQSEIARLGAAITASQKAAELQEERLEAHSAEIRAIGAEMVEQNARIAEGATQDARNAEKNKIRASVAAAIAVIAAISPIAIAIIASGPAYLATLLPLWK